MIASVEQLVSTRKENSSSTSLPHSTHFVSFPLVSSSSAIHGPLCTISSTPFFPSARLSPSVFNNLLLLDTFLLSVRSFRFLVAHAALSVTSRRFTDSHFIAPPLRFDRQWSYIIRIIGIYCEACFFHPMIAVGVSRAWTIFGSCT